MDRCNMCRRKSPTVEEHPYTIRGETKRLHLCSKCRYKYVDKPVVDESVSGFIGAGVKGFKKFLRRFWLLQVLSVAAIIILFYVVEVIDPRLK